MEGTIALLALIAGLAIGTLIGWLLSRSGTAAALATAEQERKSRESLADEVKNLREQLSAARDDKMEAETNLRNATERLAQERSLLDDAKTKLTDTFQALAAQALRQSSEGFLRLATERLGVVSTAATSDVEARKKEIETLVKPLGESLAAMNAQIQALEKARSFAYGELGNQVKSLITTQTELRSETANLVKALRAPQVRGRWGEVQLKRVVELAGMLERCDFFQQESVETDNGRLRPDLRVQLPGSRSIIVDAKTPLQAYLDALEAPTDELRTAKLKEHARRVRDHMAKLEAKAYWEQFEPGAAVRGDVPSGRDIFQRRARAGSFSHRSGQRPRDPRDTDHADRAAARRRIRMDAAGDGGECGSNSNPRARSLRAARDRGRVPRQRRDAPWPFDRRFQQGGGFV